MKRGAAPKFKELGSSPAKHPTHEDHHNDMRQVSGREPQLKQFSKDNEAPMTSPAKQTTLEEKALQSKIAKEYKLPVSKKGSMPKDFNITGSKASTTPGYSTTKLAKSKLPKDFNITGSSKAGKFAKVKKASKASKLVKGAKKALKVGGKIVGGLGVAATLYDMYKSGQKHSGGKAVKGQKSFMEESKKKTKSIWNKKK